MLCFMTHDSLYFLARSIYPKSVFKVLNQISAFGLTMLR